jgi:proteic killer suppression protein
MIESWANSATRQFATTGKCKFSGLDAPRALQLLTIINAAPSLRAISPLKSINLHALKGQRKGQWAITVNGPWRICFRFRDGNAHDVEITDYH